MFDLDGTLIDSAADIRATVNAVLADEGLESFDLDTVRGFIGRGVPYLMDQVLRARGIDDPARSERMAANMLSRYEDAVELTRLYPNVLQTLDILRQDGHRMAVCTNKPTGAARAVLRHLGLDGYFVSVTGGDSGLPRKPYPAMLLHTRRKLGEGAAIYIGDSEVDAAAAEAANLPFLMFTEGYAHIPFDRLRYRALFSDFAELPELIRAAA
ncbi:phosphoglycolate phosphatase [Paracoccus aerodenitrificans]|nr:phosphoglycolate phosphatase [Paracoccus aerodenitrificans]